MKAKNILEKAFKEHYAIGAFNAANIETLKAITNTAKKLSSPVIIEASDGEVNFIGMKQLAALVRIYEDELKIPIVLNLDHGKDFETCKKAIESGFDYIHFDGSKLPLEENIKTATELVKIARKRNVIVEGEMDRIEGSSEDHTKETTGEYLNPNLYTNPEKAKMFVEKTKIDVFASFVGNLHGLYADRKHIQIDILKKIGEAIPKTYLSLHGGSGIYEDDIKEAIKLGVVKININSEMRIAFKLTLQEAVNSTEEVAVYKYMGKPIEEVQKVVEHKIKLFGSENKA